MTLEYQIKSGISTFDWEDLPTDYNEFPALSDGDVLSVRIKTEFLPGYYRMTPTEDNPHPDVKWYNTPPWDEYDVSPKDMQILLFSRDGDFHMADKVLRKGRQVADHDAFLLRKENARKRDDVFVNRYTIRCAYDRCWHTLAKSETGVMKTRDFLWVTALTLGWKLAWPDTPGSTDLYCPATHTSMGVPTTDMQGVLYDA